MPVWKRVALGLLAATMVLAVIGIAVDAVASHDRIHPGVSVSGIKVGGLTPQAALGHINDSFAELSSEPVIVAYQEHNWEVSADDLGVDIDEERSVARAYSVGRDGGIADIVGQRLNSWFGGLDVRAELTLDESLAASALAPVFEIAEVPPVNASISIVDNVPSIAPAISGVGVDRNEFTLRLLEAYVSPDTTVAVPVHDAEADILAEDAAEALSDTKAMLSGDVSIFFGDKSWTFTPDQISTWIAFRSSTTSPSASATLATDPPPSGQVLEAYICPEKASKDVMPKIAVTARPAKSASFQVTSGSIRIVPSEDGAGPDMDSMTREMTRALAKGTTRTVEIRMTRVEPEITTQEAEGMGIKEEIATFTTRFDRSNRPRVNNIHTIANAVDGALVAPGAVFSLNDRVGRRTAERGYQEAPVIVNGRLLPGLGGGICQFGTTLFNTVFESGLTVVERRNHSLFISAYPKGRDATLAWGGPDLRFKNDTPNWILIDTSYTSSSVTVTFYGTDPGYTVTSDTGPWTNVVPYPTREVTDSTLPLAARRIEQQGANGGAVVVRRYVRKDGQVIREDSFRSVYRPKEEIVRVGTRPPASVIATPPVP